MTNESETIKTPNDILEGRIWAKWGQTYYTLAEGLAATSFVSMTRPQIIEAMQEYSSIQNQELQRILAEERQIRKNNESVMLKQYNELKAKFESLNTKP